MMKSVAFATLLCLSTFSITAADEPPKLEVTVDTTQAPDVAEWGAKAKTLVEEWHPKLCTLLASEGFRAPQQVKLVFVKDAKGVASTTGSTISISADWIRKHPDDYGMVIHELTHVIQAYPKYEAGWLVEGIADYTRFYHFEPDAKLSGINPAKASYKDAYRTTAMFLAWIEQTQDKEFIAKLNEALRTGRYRYEFFKLRTGKSLDRLWADFLEDEASQGRK